MHLLSVDVETTGLDPKTNNIIEFAAVYVDTMDPNRTRINFRRLIRHPLYIGEAVALGMNGAIFKEIGEAEKANDGTELICTQEELLGELAVWIDSLGLNLSKEGDKLTLTGKNVGSFDLQFLKMIPGWDEFNRAARLGHRCLDPGPLYWSPFDRQMPDLKTCLQRAGLLEQVSHRALDDAHKVLDVIEARYKLAVNKKTGETYSIMGPRRAIDATNAHNGEEVRIYMNKDFKFFVREVKEFREKFDPGNF